MWVAHIKKCVPGAGPTLFFDVSTLHRHQAPPEPVRHAPNERRVLRHCASLNCARLPRCRDRHRQAQPIICVTFWAVTSSLWVPISLFLSLPPFLLYRHRLWPVHKRADRLQDAHFGRPKRGSKMAQTLFFSFFWVEYCCLFTILCAGAYFAYVWAQSPNLFKCSDSLGHLCSYCCMTHVNQWRSYLHNAMQINLGQRVRAHLTVIRSKFYLNKNRICLPRTSISRQKSFSSQCPDNRGYLQLSDTERREPCNGPILIYRIENFGQFGDTNPSQYGEFLYESVNRHINSPNWLVWPFCQIDCPSIRQIDLLPPAMFRHP